MKRILFMLLALMFGVRFLMAEPLTLEQAGNVLQKGTLEIGLADMAYQTDQTKFTDAGGNVIATLTNTATIVPLYARYAITPKIEATINVPYSSISYKEQPTGGTSTSYSDSGLSDPTIMGKYSLELGSGWEGAAAAAFTLPEGAQSKQFPGIGGVFQQGTNIKPILAARKMFGEFAFNANVSYNIEGSFTDEYSVKQAPGNVMSAGIGAERAWKGINWIGEFVYNNLEQSSVAGVAQKNSAGSQMDVVVGGRYNYKNFKTKLGVDVSLGDETYRTYDYRVIAGVTYLWTI